VNAGGRTADGPAPVEARSDRTVDPIPGVCVGAGAGSTVAACASAPTALDVDLVEVVQRVVDRYRDRDRIVALDRSGERLPVAGDPVLLERVLEHLIDNAIAAGSDRIQVGLRRERDDCVLAVLDDGPGVPEGLRDRIFAAHVSGRGGTGLGLFLARQVARSHGGDIALVETPRGAHFRLRLPGRWS
jgi:two-component system OmpR family sensor kinase